MSDRDGIVPAELQFPGRDELVSFLARLRGRYVIPIRDGAGLLDGKKEFDRSFPVPPIAAAAADVISVLALFAYTSSEAPAEMHDLAAALLNAPSMSHGCYTPEDLCCVVDRLLGRVR